MTETIAYLREFHFASVVLRLALAMLLGGCIGLERERKRRPAGFRTYMLVCLGATLTVLLSLYEFTMVTGPWSDICAEIGIKTDVSRFGAQVINGIGFLGAGTILVTGRQQVKGLTTAAGLWASACTGLAVVVTDDVGDVSLLNRSVEPDDMEEPFVPFDRKKRARKERTEKKGNI